MDTLKKAELTASIRHIYDIFKIMTTDLQFRSSGYFMQKNEKKEKRKNTGNCKALFILRKRNKGYLLWSICPIEAERFNFSVIDWM